MLLREARLDVSVLFTSQALHSNMLQDQAAGAESGEESVVGWSRASLLPSGDSTEGALTQAKMEHSLVQQVKSVTRQRGRRDTVESSIRKSQSRSGVKSWWLGSLDSSTLRLIDANFPTATRW